MIRGVPLFPFSADAVAPTTHHSRPVRPFSPSLLHPSLSHCHMHYILRTAHLHIVPLSPRLPRASLRTPLVSHVFNLNELPPHQQSVPSSQGTKSGQCSNMGVLYSTTSPCATVGLASLGLAVNARAGWTVLLSSSPLHGTCCRAACE